MAPARKRAAPCQEPTRNYFPLEHKQSSADAQGVYRLLRSYNFFLSKQSVADPVAAAVLTLAYHLGARDE